MPEDSRNNNRPNNEQNNNLSSSFVRYSDALTKNSTELKKNSGSLDNNSGSLDNNTKALLEMVKSFNSTVNNLSRDLNNFTKDTEKAFNKINSEFDNAIDKQNQNNNNKNKDSEKVLSRAEQAGHAFVGALQVVGERLVTQFSKAVDRVASSYKDNFTDITVKMQWSQSEYSDMFNSMASEFLSQGLGTQFSPTDFATALSETLATGLRGDEAQRQAYQNLITNRLMPAISTNTREYRQMSKFFGTTFTEGITAISKYAESTYGAEGLDENQINNIISATSASMRLQGARSGLSDEQIQNQINELTYGINAMAQAGINPDQFISTLQSTLEGTEINTAFAAAGGGTADTLIAQLNSDPLGFMERYVNIVAQEGSGQTAQNYVSEALGVNATTGIETLAAVESGALDWDQIRQDYSGFNQDAEYDKWMNKLEDGFGKSIDAQADTWEENMTTPVGVLSAEIPRSNELLSDIKRILEIMTATSLFSSKGDILNNLGGKLGDFFTKKGWFSGAGASSKGLSSLASAGAEGTGGSTLSTGVGLASKGLAGASIVGGLVMGGVDAYKSGKHTADAGGSTSDIVGSGVHGFLTGNVKMTTEEEDAALDQALLGQGQKFDWGALVSNTAKYTAVGAGVGTLAGGIGAVPGAIAGGITGAVENALDQLVTNHKYNELADATNDLTESFTQLQQTQQEYESVVSDSASSQENIDLIKNSLNKNTAISTEELDTAFKSLQKEYPEYLGNIKDVSEMDEAYLKVLEKKIEKEQELAKKELAGDVENTSEKMSTKRTKTKDAVGDVKSQASLAAAKDLSKLDITTASSESINKILKSTAKEYGVSVKDLTKELQSGESGKIFSVNDDGDVTGFNSLAIGNNVEQYLEDYEDSSKSQAKAQSALEEEVGQIQEIWDTILATANSSNKSENPGEYKFSKSDKEIISGMIKNFNKQVKGHNKYAKEVNLGGMEDIILEKSEFDNISEIYKAAGKDKPSFKIGAYNINSDTEASLHKGEMVLTSANAEKLRQLDRSGLDGTLNIMKYASEIGNNIKQNNVRAVSDTSNTSALQSAVVTAIESQTETLVSYLSSINTAVLSLVQGKTLQASKVSEATLTYQGR